MEVDLRGLQRQAPARADRPGGHLAASFHAEIGVRIAVIPGDGIGKDVTAEAVKVIRVVGEVFGRPFDLELLPYGADHYLETGISLPPNGSVMLRDEFDAIFIGALGDPRIPDMRHARDILLGIRFELDLYINHRPVRLLDARLCPLKDRGPADVDLVIFRENTEGLYVGVGGRFKPGTADEIAVQEEINTYKGVHRIVKHAFDYARARGLKRVCMADKSNAMTHGHALWQRVFEELTPGYAELEATHLFIDALAMQMIKNPAQFDVIVTNNMFGDIITDLGAQLQGGLGMAASGNLHPGRTSMFEPVHGSAPKYAGRNVANPMGAILSAALMLEHLGLHDEAAAIETAVRQAVVSHNGPAEIGGSLGTRETGDYIVGRLMAPMNHKP
ncbi:MAG: 3-isopropylmalate dehydrogenase [Acidobacteria bacterium]|nr:3-isopropylmalate dehydrogenase [Acidobacteriota bacterium]